MPNNEESYPTEEADRILNVLHKKQGKGNKKKLEYFYTIYLKKKQENKDLYFYQFVFDWVKHHLKDKPKKWLFFKNDILPLLFFTSLLFLIFCLIFNSYIDIINLWKEGTIKTSIIFTISITIITSLFFVIKIYIDNKYSKEKEKMNGEMETRFDRQDSIMDKRLNDQDLKLNMILKN